MEWLIPISAFPLIFTGWISLHEGSHAIVAEHEGNTVEAFRPYPHVFRGTLYFGRTTTNQRPSQLVASAPYISDALMFSALFPLSMRLSNGFSRWIVLAMMLAPIVDTTMGFIAYLGDRENSDMARMGSANRFIFFSLDIVYIALTTVAYVRAIRDLRSERR